MRELNARIWIEEGLLIDAVNLLDENYIENDIDDGDRIMVSDEDVDEACAIFDEAGIDYELI